MSAESPNFHLIEGRRKFVRTDVLPEWYDTFVYGNLSYPRHTVGIFPLVGNEIIRSLQNGDVTIADVAYSRLTAEQFDDLQGILINTHRAYGIRAVPEGHKKKGESEFSAHEWLNGNWNDIKTSVVRTFAYFGATKHPHAEYTNARDLDNSPLNSLAYALRRQEWWDIDDGSLDNLLRELMKSEEYTTLLPTIAKMYETASRTLNSDEVLALGRHRRERMSPKHSHIDDYPYPSHYEWEIMRRVKLDLDQMGLPQFLESDASVLFLNATTSERRPDIVKETKFKRIPSED